MVVLLVVLFMTVQSVFTAQPPDELIIALRDGKVQGTKYTTENNKNFYGFHGIPYAAPPLGNLRFEAPRPPQPWGGVLDATKDRYACITAFNFFLKEVESEDCLSINVYTPSLKPERKLPVMLWIYGGKFVVGSNWKDEYGPDFLMEEDVIVVIPNYRLGVFGFLSTGDSAIVGNAGLKDQALAIKWVNDNIKYFGGDPGKVTIFGESAGGASVGLQLLNKWNEGLYRAAIIGSGSAVTNWTIDPKPKEYVDLLINKLGGGGYINDTRRIKTFLQEQSATDIINAAYLLGSRDNDVTTIIKLPDHQAWPVIEVENENAFLTESPYQLLDSGRFNQVPVILGICANEAAMIFLDLGSLEKAALDYDTFPNTIIPQNLRQNTSNNEVIVRKIKSLYLKDGDTFSNDLVALTNFQSDTMFTRGVIKQAELMSRYVPVHLYQFSYFGRPRFPYVPPGAEKAAHGAELPFLFKQTDSSDPTDILTQNRMVRLWANFAKYLDPTPRSSQLIDVIWPTITATNLQYLNINATLEVRSPLRENYAGWNDIYYTYGKKPFVTF